MQTHVTGQPALGALRQVLLATLIGNPLLSPQEQWRASHHIHECEDVGRLTRWAHTIKAELARRNIAAQTSKALARYAASERQRLPLPCLRKLRQPQLPRRAPKLTVSTLARCYVADHPATTQDRRAASQFYPARTLTYAQLLRH